MPPLKNQTLETQGSLSEIKRDLAACLREIFSSDDESLTPRPDPPRPRASAAGISNPEIPNPELPIPEKSKPTASRLESQNQGASAGKTPNSETSSQKAVNQTSRLRKIQEGELKGLLEQPRMEAHGHLALPVFRLPRAPGQSPQLLAKSLEEKIKGRLPLFLKSVQAISGFLNFTFKEDFLRSRLQTLLSKKTMAFFDSACPERWTLDFASPNVAKRINVGHLRAAAQGQAMANLARRFGCHVISVNHLGDWGSQFGKLLWAWKAWAGEYDFEKKPFESLTALYTRFYEEAESDPKKLKEATDLFQKLEAGDPDLKKLWRRFTDLSLENYDRFWKILNIKHDQVLGESFYADFLNSLKNRLREKGLLKKSEGAEAVFLESGPPCLITKSDGASTYSARDLCAAIYRFEEWKADRNIYITGSDQKLHFKQIFEVLGKLSPDWESRSRHLTFGMYRFKGKGKMSTRRGQAVYLKDLLEQAVERVEKIISERRPDEKNKRQIAEQVGIGALVFNDLMNDRIKDVDFDWDRVLDFEGQSGPFVQYSHVRCLSLIKKYGKPPAKQFSALEEEELILAWKLLCFEEAVFQSFKLLKPHILARCLLDLAGAFNRFYASRRILGSEKEAELMLLVEGVRLALNEGLQILNVPRPKAM